MPSRERTEFVRRIHYSSTGRVTRRTIGDRTSSCRASNKHNASPRGRSALCDVPTRTGSGTCFDGLHAEVEIRFSVFCKLRAYSPATTSVAPSEFLADFFVSFKMNAVSLGNSDLSCFDRLHLAKCYCFVKYILMREYGDASDKTTLCLAPRNLSVILILAFSIAFRRAFNQ
jgi:hypothetical protein